MNAALARHLTLLTLAAALVVLAWPAAAPAQGAEPSLGLIGPAGTVTLERMRGGRVALDLGVWVAASGGDFEIRAARADYDQPIEAAQVEGGSDDVLRDVPAEMLAGWNGLSRFIRVVVRDQAGRTIKVRRYTFCPNGWERQRVDDSGPEVPRYPTQCGSFSPFTKGMVWGIDEGWATSALGNPDFGVRMMRIRRTGRYVITVAFARPYRELFGIPAEAARVIVQARVRNVRHSCCEGMSVPAGRPAERRGIDAGVPDDTDPDPSTLPDLVALPLWSLTTFSRRGRDFVGFAATPWNAGPAPMVVEGFRRPAEAVMDAYQYFRNAGGTSVGRAPVGTMRFHSHRSHNHWHFLQFAAFTLHAADDLEVVRSRKQAFCLAPTDAIDLTLPRAEYNPWGSLSTSCGSQGALWVREVLQAGWGDTYFQGIPGQAFNITGLPNGWYYVGLEVNPLGNLYERTAANNVESRLIHLGGRPGRRTVIATPWHGIDW
jgi:Lysyl oxidase